MIVTHPMNVVFQKGLCNIPNQGPRGTATDIGI